MLDVIDACAHDTALTEAADTCTDIPLYRAGRRVKQVDDVADMRSQWAAHPNVVSLLIGCSFLVGTPLQEDGIEVQHIADGSNVPKHRTSSVRHSIGRSHGEMVVSMRPIRAYRIADAVSISRRFLSARNSIVRVAFRSRWALSTSPDPTSLAPYVLSRVGFPVCWARSARPEAAVMASGVL
ncbi:D-glutamate cyclase family protein [Burkholderia savannae]|uniref:D-glutamate cyclase family protein n=1 Tax=Burkholderia savannae TaxID=1637837 RepID=UPI0018D25F32|nr:DUF1445 domain-containing protein [Burkholderia savannae]